MQNRKSRSQEASHSASDRPNIVLIIMDCARADHLSCYGYRRNTTPNIDAIAAEGTVYENAISPAVWSLPAVASIFTGLYPSQHGTHAKHQFLESRFMTMAETLRSCGYQTAAFTNNGWVTPAFGFDRGFMTFREVYRRFDILGQLFKREAFVEKAYRHLVTQRYDLGGRRTNKLVKQWFADSHDGQSPFFLFIHYAEPHLPHNFPEPYFSLYLPDGMNTADAAKVNQDAWQYMAGEVDMSDEDFGILKSLYDGELTYLDHRMTEILDLLKDRRILDDTVLIITADHGENLGEHGLMDHQFCVYDTLIHVPLIIRYPKLFAPGSRVKAQVQTLDVLPTIMDILGISHVANNLSGSSLLSPETRPWPFTIAEYLEPFLDRFRKRHPKSAFPAYDRNLKAIRTDRFKYVWASDGMHELYDLMRDPAEEINLLPSEVEIASRMDKMLQQWQGSLELADQSEYAPEIDGATLERLRGLGYIE